MRIFGNFQAGETRPFTEEDPITKQPVGKVRVVSKIFDNADLGFHKITVERSGDPEPDPELRDTESVPLNRHFQPV